MQRYRSFPSLILIGASTALLACGEDQAQQRFETGTGGAAPGDGGTTGDGGAASGGTLGSGGSGASPGGASTGGQQSAGGADGQSGGGGSGGAPAGGSAGSGGSSQTAVDWPLINGVQWADVDGNPIQAHGGGMLKVGKDYYWFGENRNSDGTFFAVSAYRSRDLRRWEHAADVLTMNSDPGLAPANVERPKVVYNDTTGKYVMWMHWENGQHYGEARAAVASSDTVDGDYTYHGSFRPYQDAGVMDHDRPGYMSRDCTLFVDDDGTAYFLSASNENYDLHLYSLTPNYLEINQREAVLFEGGHREAPALFKRGDTYFLITSGSTGWDPNQAQYATSTSLKSGWSSLRNIGNGTTFYSQSTYVQAVEGSEGTEYLYMGDRWAGAWGGRVNDSSYLWQAIEFTGQDTISMNWDNVLSLDANAGIISGSVENFQFVNKQSGLLLAAEQPVTENSADAIQGGDLSSHTWRLDYNAQGHFKLVHEPGGKVLDVPDESTSPVALHLWDDNNGAHQAWRVIDLGEGEYRLKNQNSGLFLGVAGAASEEGVRVEQQNESDGNEQIWMIELAE